MKAVIQAGGQGTRLRPFTLVLPKPLMPVGDLPVIEMLLKWLRRNDIDQAFITTGHLGHLLRAVCGDGRQWGMNIVYSEEPEPLGTVGALHLIAEHLDQTFLMLNGDLVTDLDLRAFGAHHRNHGGPLTVAVTEKIVKVDLGVIQSSNGRIHSFEEKPALKFKVSMGVYCMEPSILKLIPKGVPFGFDNLMHAMLARDLPVHTYEHNGMWMDIGRPEDFRRAQEISPDTGMLGA
jgi:NDP-sugar pyrophosphorylase family protein